MHIENKIILAHECLNCKSRNQRFNFDVKKVKGECLDCVKKSNFVQSKIENPFCSKCKDSGVKEEYDHHSGSLIPVKCGCKG